MRTLRQRFILSHILPLLLVTPLMGVALIFLLESQVVLVNLSTSLERQAALIAEFAADSPAPWRDAEQAQLLLARLQPRLAAELALLQADGTLLASADPADAALVGQRLPDANLTAVGAGESSVERHYSQDLRADVVEILVPVLNADAEVLGILRLTQPLSTVYDRFQRVRTFVLWVLAPGLLAGIAAGIVLAELLRRPLLAVTRGIARMAGPPKDAIDPSQMALPEQGPHEVRLLVRSFNTLVSHLHAAERERRMLLANLLHELGTPLGALRSAVDALLGGAAAEPRLRQSLLGGMNGELQRLQRLLADLSRLYDQQIDRQALQRQPVAMDAWLHTTLSPWRAHVQEQGIDWQTTLPEFLPVLCIDPDRLGQVLGNLLSNAVKFTPAGGCIAVEAGIAGRELYLRVRDSGPGIPLHEQHQVFEPFFRSTAHRDRTQGMGVGLAIARDLATAHGGRLSLHSTPGQGATFTIHLPLDAATEQER